MQPIRRRDFSGSGDMPVQLQTEIRKKTVSESEKQTVSESEKQTVRKNTGLQSLKQNKTGILMPDIRLKRPGSDRNKDDQKFQRDQSFRR